MTSANMDTYSQFVRFAKIGLPVLAVLLFAGVFVFSKTNPIRDGAIISGPDLAQLAIGQKITNPHYSGVTKSGDAFSISAESALPNAPAPDQIDLVAPRTMIDFADGLDVMASAESGYLNLETQVAILTGAVQFDTSNQYKAHADKIVLDFYTGNAHSPGPVNATGPMGNISAGKMSLTQNLHQNASTNEAILSFGNGVKLVYYPEDIQK